MKSCYVLVLDGEDGGTHALGAYTSLPAAEESRRSRLQRPDVADTLRLLGASYRIVCVPLDGG